LKKLFLEASQVSLVGKCENMWIETDRLHRPDSHGHRSSSVKEKRTLSLKSDSIEAAFSSRFKLLNLWLQFHSFLLEIPNEKFDSGRNFSWFQFWFASLLRHADDRVRRRTSYVARVWQSFSNFAPQWSRR